MSTTTIIIIGVLVFVGIAVAAVLGLALFPGSAAALEPPPPKSHGLVGNLLGGILGGL